MADNPRACVVEIVNGSELALRLTSVKLDHGTFAQPPQEIIEADACDAFVVTSRPENPGAGCGGSVEYADDDGVAIALRFDKPYVGCDSGSATILRGDPRHHECITTIEADEFFSRCRFVFRRRYP
jgi:hypothetical protein